MSERKARYKAYCETHLTIPLFLRSDWLTAVVGEDNWDVVLEEKGDVLFGALPYAIRKKGFFRLLTMPPLTPYLGVWLNYPEEQKVSTRLAFEKETIYKLLAQLESNSFFQHKFLPGFTNALPFHWKGYDISTRFTYLLKNLTSEEVVFGNFQQNIRRQIRKAEKHIKVVESDQIDRLYELKKASYQQNGQNLVIPPELVHRIYDACIKKDCARLLSANDDSGEAHAMLLIVWDENTCYYLFGASHPKHKNSGAMSLLMWKAIQQSMKMHKEFNFEGSMIESIERFFRGFGAEQAPYFQIEKKNSRLFQLLSFLKR